MNNRAVGQPRFRPSLHRLFARRIRLQGRVVDVRQDGFLTTMDVSCWTFIACAPRGAVDAERRDNFSP